MDSGLQSHGFGNIDESPEQTSAPAGVDEAEMILSREGTSSNPTSNIDNFPRPARQDVLGQPVRPGLRREGSAHQAPPPPPPQPESRIDTEESLSLLQLKSLVRDLPQAESAAYAYEYQDTATLPEELEEWFAYGSEDRDMILQTYRSFDEEWAYFSKSKPNRLAALVTGKKTWSSQTVAQRRKFVSVLLDGLGDADTAVRTRRLEALAYVALGTWHESAGVLKSPGDLAHTPANASADDAVRAWYTSHEYSAVHLHAIEENVALLIELGALPTIYGYFRRSCQPTTSTGNDAEISAQTGDDTRPAEFWCSSTILYFILQICCSASDSAFLLKTRRQVLNLVPSIPEGIAQVMDKMRWDDTLDVPPVKLLLVYWKAVLLSLGSSTDLRAAKASFSQDEIESSDKKGFPIITASPLDYSLFRQEISSKYPAYNPPPPLFPLEPDTHSFLQPLKTTSTKDLDIANGLGSLQGHSSSLLQTPMHIATPAPSPPPSPAIGGKTGKKQNYQTNQMLPFLYPPLDGSSNQLGGTGSTELQDVLVGRKWQGPDIPASILEAAELFSQRMRATRAMKQLWEQRVEFMKYERGWKAPADDSDVESVILISDDPRKEAAEIVQPVPEDGGVEDRLAVVEQFYKDALPYLQSIVMVLVKVILSHVTALVTQLNNQNGLQSGFEFQHGQNGDLSARLDASSSLVDAPNGAAPSGQDVSTNRSQEIAAKAVSGILFLLLKWFKASHILKYEYLTQLLVDASYIPIILKLMQSQEIDTLVSVRSDVEELGFFYICRANSAAGIEEPEPPKIDDETSFIQQSSSEDEAAPPPIKRHRTPATGTTTVDMPNGMMSSPEKLHTPLHESGTAASTVPEVDELGIPTGAPPPVPITTFSQRNFYSAITSLRVLRAVCARHAHRNLMLVQYKSTPVLRRILRIPQPDLRRCALKLVKAQVPFCGRKWRQANMRVITAVWLSIRPELRDDWLSGGDVDSVVEEAVPREQAIRGLVHWWHLRKYWNIVGPRGTVEADEDGGQDIVDRLKSLSLDETDGDADDAQAEAVVGLEAPPKSVLASKSKQERQRWLEEESDFFRKELARMDWDWASDTESVDGQSEAGGTGQGYGALWERMQSDGVSW